jgi:hypothetical protein
MSLQDLSPEERIMVRECLSAIAQGPFIDEWEFQTRIGVDREKVISMLDSWPNIDDRFDDCEETITINNCLNEICYGIDIPPPEWLKWFTASRSSIEEAYKAWAIKRGWNRTGIQ